MICIPVAAETTAEVLAMMEAAAPLADLIELRIDGMRDCDLVRLLQNRPRPIIVTNRRQEEGGAFRGTEAERIALLAAAARLGADYLDVETATPPSLKAELRRLCDKSGTQRIASWHDFSGTPQATFLEERLAAGLADAPAVVKLVTLALSEADNLRVLSLLPLAQGKGPAITAFCMGQKGRISRVMAPLFGSLISYAPLAEAGASAPGQLTAGRMREILRLLQDVAPAEGASRKSPHGENISGEEKKRP